MPYDFYAQPKRTRNFVKACVLKEAEEQAEWEREEERKRKKGGG